MLSLFGNDATNIINLCDDKGHTAAHYAAGELWAGIITAQPILLQPEIEIAICAEILLIN